MSQLNELKKDIDKNLNELQKASEDASSLLFKVTTIKKAFFELLSIPENSRFLNDGEILEFKTEMLSKIVSFQEVLTNLFIETTVTMINDLHDQAKEFLDEFNGLAKDLLSGSGSDTEYKNMIEKKVQLMATEFENSVIQLIKATDSYSQKAMEPISKNFSQVDDFFSLKSNVLNLKLRVRALQRTLTLVKKQGINLNVDIDHWNKMFEAKKNNSRQEWNIDLTMKEAIIEVFKKSASKTLNTKMIVKEIYNTNLQSKDESVAQKNIVAVLHRHSPDIFITKETGKWELAIKSN